MFIYIYIYHNSDQVCALYIQLQWKQTNIEMQYYRFYITGMTEGLTQEACIYTIMEPYGALLSVFNLQGKSSLSIYIYIYMVCLAKLLDGFRPQRRSHWLGPMLMGQG